MTVSSPDTDTQYAGLTELERAAAMAEPHMRECDAPTIDECLQCRGVLRVIRRVIEAVAPVAVAVERERVKQLLTLPTLNAVRAIPDGRIQNGCVVMDGGQVRERLRRAYLAIDAPELPTDPGVFDEIAAEMDALAPARKRATTELLAEPGQETKP